MRRRLTDEEREGLELGTILRCAFCNGLSDDRRHIGYAGMFSEDIPNVISHSNDFVGPWKDRHSVAKKPIWVHRRCAIWSPRVYIDEKTLKMKNVVQEAKRAKRLFCADCKRAGAANGCIMDRCTKSYHIFCAENSFCFVDHSKFQIICPQHFLLLFRQKYKLNLVYNRPTSSRLYSKIRNKQENLSQQRASRELNAPLSINVMQDSSVVGLEEPARILKECLILPLVYRELFEQLKLETCGGIILYGPPGNGKTSLVRSVIRECERLSHNGLSISVFSRKGADVLSKFYGEAEKTLRDLFDQAQKAQPSVIFFDEFDALAPSRNARQNQVHSSIVSTLLSLMDGMSHRGRVVVIAATNRVDAIDPALRRPGRFDKEIYIAPPTRPAKLQMIRKFLEPCNHEMDEDDLERIVDQCVHLSGAEVKGICVEAVIQAIERKCPEIDSIENITSHLYPTFQDIDVKPMDFDRAMMKGNNRKHSQRNYFTLPLKQLLKEQVDECIGRLADLQRSKMKQALCSPVLIHKLLLNGSPGSGQKHIAKEIIDQLDLTNITLELATLQSHESPPSYVAQQCSRAIAEAPCILYLPDLDSISLNIADDTFHTLITSIASLTMQSSKPILILATCSFEWSTRSVFTNQFPLPLYTFFSRNTHLCKIPSINARYNFFKKLVDSFHEEDDRELRELAESTVVSFLNAEEVVVKVQEYIHQGICEIDISNLQSIVQQLGLLS